MMAQYINNLEAHDIYFVSSKFRAPTLYFQHIKRWQ